MDLFNTLVHRLNTGRPVNVEFRKTDGSIRQMSATWGEKGTIDGANKVRVWDTELGDYRCIKAGTIRFVR